MQQGVAIENNREMIGKTVELMVEGQSKLATPPAYPSAGGVELGGSSDLPRRRPGWCSYWDARGDQIVAFNGNESFVGRFVDVEITAARNLTLFGRVKAQVFAAAN